MMRYFVLSNLVFLQLGTLYIPWASQLRTKYLISRPLRLSLHNHCRESVTLTRENEQKNEHQWQCQKDQSFEWIYTAGCYELSYQQEQHGATNAVWRTTLAIVLITDFPTNLFMLLNEYADERSKESVGNDRTHYCTPDWPDLRLLTFQYSLQETNVKELEKEYMTCP